MRVVFAGGGGFALPAMELLAQTREIVLVLTPPPKPAGRKLQLRPCPVALRARELNLPLLETADSGAVANAAAKAKADVMVVADYGLLLPPLALNATPRGALNIHPSLLPRWRGAMPVAHAILAGDSEIGVCIMQMDEGYDTGAVLLQQKMPMPETLNCGELTAKLANTGAEMLATALAENPAPTPQSKEGIKYAPKLPRAAGNINYDTPADYIARQVRAFAPMSPARTVINGVTLGVHKAAAVKCPNNNATNGEILSADNNGIVIKCAQNAITLTELQRPGKKSMPAPTFLRGFPLPPRARAASLPPAPSRHSRTSHHSRTSRHSRESGNPEFG